MSLIVYIALFLTAIQAQIRALTIEENLDLERERPSFNKSVVKTIRVNYTLYYPIHFKKTDISERKIIHCIFIKTIFMILTINFSLIKIIKIIIITTE